MYPAVARAERVLWPIRCKCNRGPDLLVVPRAVEDVIAHVVMRLLAGAHAFISETKTCRHQSFPAKADRTSHCPIDSWAGSLRHFAMSGRTVRNGRTTPGEGEGDPGPRAT